MIQELLLREQKLMRRQGILLVAVTLLCFTGLLLLCFGCEGEQPVPVAGACVSPLDHCHLFFDQRGHLLREGALAHGMTRLRQSGAWLRRDRRAARCNALRQCDEHRHR